MRIGRAMREAAARKIEELFDILRIDHRADHNTRDTPARVARMFVEETMRGRFTPPPHLTEFDNVERCDQMIVTGPIDVRSTCAHHLMPVLRPCRDRRPAGARRQDSGPVEIRPHRRLFLGPAADPGRARQTDRALYRRGHRPPAALAVRISAVHMCKSHRGVRSSRASRMVNTSFHGELATNPQLRGEFLAECAMLERDGG